MNRPIKWFFYLGLIAVFGLPTAFADSNIAANQLFVETAKLLLEAKQAPVERQIELYQRALSNLDKIVAQYPGSDLAVKLASGQAIGKIDRSKIESDQREAKKAACYQQPEFSCIVLLALDAARVIDIVPSHTFLLGKIAVAQAKMGDKEGAQATLQQALDNTQLIKAERGAKAFYPAPALGWIAAAQVAVGNKGSAEATLRQALDAARKMDGNRASALEEVAIAQAAVGEFGQALDITRKIDKPYNHRPLYNIIANQAAAGEFGQASITARILDDRGSIITALILIAEAQAKVGDSEKAEATLREALDAARTLETTERAHTLATLAAIQAKMGNREGAQAIIREALDATRLLDDTLGTAKAFSRAKAFGGIAAAQAATGDQAGAQATLKEALDNIPAIDSATWQQFALFRIAEAQAGAGDFKQALDTTRAIDDKDYRPSILYEIAVLQAREGYFKQALATTQMIDTADDRALALVDIAAKMAEAKHKP